MEGEQQCLSRPDGWRGADVQAIGVEYSEVFRNRKRWHSGLGHLPPPFGKRKTEGISGSGSTIISFSM